MNTKEFKIKKNWKGMILENMKQLEAGLEVQVQVATMSEYIALRNAALKLGLSSKKQGGVALLRKGEFKEAKSGMSVKVKGAFDNWTHFDEIDKVSSKKLREMIAEIGRFFIECLKLLQRETPSVEIQLKMLSIQDASAMVWILRRRGELGGLKERKDLTEEEFQKLAEDYAAMTGEEEEFEEASVQRFLVSEMIEVNDEVYAKRGALEKM